MRIQIRVTTPSFTASAIPPPHRPLYRASSTRGRFIQTSLWREVLLPARTCSASARSSSRRRMQRILLAPGIFSAVQIAMNRLFNRTRASGSAPADSALSAASARWTASSLAASGSLRVDAAGLSGFDSLIICSRVPKRAAAAREPGSHHRPCFQVYGQPSPNVSLAGGMVQLGKTVPGWSEVAPDEGCRGQRDRARGAPGCARS